MLTYLMNNTRKEYILLNSLRFHRLPHYMLKLGEHSNWNIRHDDIIISLSYSNLGYKNIFNNSLEDAGAGEVLEEVLTIS
jgi:hypothetical protein